MSALSWGYRYAMCAPTHFEVAYAINPWMGGTVDPVLAMQQWRSLGATMRLAGADIETVDPVEGLPDMVFAANAGVVDGNRLIAGMMRHPERRAETAAYIHWAVELGLGVERLSPDSVLEGLGDAMPLRDVLVSGNGSRTNTAAHAELTRLTGRQVISVELADPRWYHVDLTLCPLDQRRAMVYPDAYDTAGARQVLAQIPEPLILDEADAATFAVNSIVIGTTVVMPACPPRLGRKLEAWGFDVVVVDVGEFLKAGGAVRCLTLPLDTRLSSPAIALQVA